MFYMSGERITRFFDVSRELNPRALSGKILRVKSRYPESFRFLGLWGGWNSLLNGLWQLFSEYEPLLRHLICIIYHHYLPWFPSEYHLWIMFDNSYCQHVLSQSQKHCFKEFAHFGKKYWTYSSKSLLNLFIRLKIFILLNIFIPPILKGYTRRNVECSNLSIFILLSLFIRWAYSSWWRRSKSQNQA